MRGSAVPDALQQRDQELGALRGEQLQTLESERKLKAEIEALGADRRKLNQALIDTGARIRGGEERSGAAEQRLAQLGDSERGIRDSLERRRTVIADILAALQRIGHRPPPALMVRSEDALESLRAAMMFGSVLPDMRIEAETLVADLSELQRVREASLRERDQLAGANASLVEERARMSALVDERQKRQGDVEKQLDGERARAAQLARQADNLKDLIGKLEQGLDTATRQARAAARLAEEAKLQETPRASLAALSDPGRLAPGISFASAKGLLSFPASGVKTRDYGAPDGMGGAERGASITTRAGAQVTAPCDGWVVYAAPYRSYGQLLILNAGGGYHILLAGMDRISVDPGQFVLTGEPVAVMGSGTQLASTSTSGSVQPVLYIEFRKDGTPVDPAPWWATTDSEKVRG